MENQSKLLEIMQEIKEIAAAQQNKLTKEEVQKYLGSENLSEEKWQAVYQYLGENNIKVEGYCFVPVSKSSDITKKKTEADKNNAEEVSEQTEKKESRRNATGKAGEEKESRRETNMKLYRREIAGFAGEPEETQILAFLQGDNNLKNTIIEKYLQKVIKIADNYKKRNVPADELIAEGNVGLLTGMKIIEQNKKEYVLADGSLNKVKFFGMLDMEITHAMEMYIDDITESADWENAMLAKTNLLHEAAKYMAEEIGRVPTIEELSEYTKISREEIKDIMGLSEDAKRVASGERV